MAYIDERSDYQEIYERWEEPEQPHDAYFAVRDGDWSVGRFEAWCEKVDQYRALMETAEF